MQEDNLIKAIEKKTGTALTMELKEMVRLYYQGLSIKKIAQKTGMTFDKARYRLRTLAKKMGASNFKEFIAQYKHNQQNDSKNTD